MAEPTYVRQNSLKRPAQHEPTQAFYKEHSEGFRFGSSPNETMRVAPYLPYVRFNAGAQVHEVILGGTFMGRDASLKLVPANGVPQGLTDYPGRALKFAAIDTDDANGLINFNAVDGALLESGDINADLINVSLSANSGVESMGFVGVRAGRFPIGALFETALEGKMNLKKINFDPQPTLTVIAHYVLEFGEFVANKRNYGQAVIDALQEVDDLTVGTPGTLAPVAAKPDWVPVAGTDAIEAGDLVAIDDRGRLVRYSIASTTIGAGTAETEFPVGTLGAVVGRCWATETVLSLGALDKVSTTPGARVVGGSRPDTANAGAQAHLEGASRRLLIKIELG